MRKFESVKYFNPHVFHNQPNNNYGSKLIFNHLLDNKPLAIGKLGSVENSAIRKYIKNKDSLLFENSVRGNLHELYNNAGLFPEDHKTYVKYCDYMIKEVLPELNIVAVWFNYGEHKILKMFAPKCKKVSIGSLESYVVEEKFRWTKYLEGKKILVIHPFKNSIIHQYRNIDSIWRDNPHVFPEFHLSIIKAPFQASVEVPIHRDWFEALNSMSEKMSNVDFDILLVGAGAFSLPLAVHAKKLGKVGIHLGGALQIYFGIYGKRWEMIPKFKSFYNPSWIRPLSEDSPIHKIKIEDGCYW
jgi:hypothetical protein